jgi:hypothetical protein
MIQVYVTGWQIPFTVSQNSELKESRFDSKPNYSHIMIVVCFWSNYKSLVYWELQYSYRFLRTTYNSVKRNRICFLYSKNGGHRFFQNVGVVSADYTASHWNPTIANKASQVGKNDKLFRKVNFVTSENMFIVQRVHITISINTQLYQTWLMYEFEEETSCHWQLGL